PLPGPPSAYPLLAFTHTVLHRYLVKHRQVEADRLLLAFGPDVPLYSVLPFQILAAHSDPVEPCSRTLEQVVQRSFDLAIHLDRGPDWKLAAYPLKAAERLIEDNRDRLGGDERRRFRIQLLSTRLSVLRR